MNTLTLAQRWQTLKEQQPHLRIRNAAQELGVSEVELLASRCGDGVTRLRPPFNSLLLEIVKLGKVMALTRNEEVVHERKGVYLHPQLDNPHVGLFVGADIDLRIFFSVWDSAFAVSEMARGKMRHSLQFFARNGEAIHKIYLTPASDEAAYWQLLNDFRHEDQQPGQSVQPDANPQTDAEIPDEQIALQDFQQGWLNLQDTHDFYGLLKKHQLSRLQALRLAPDGGYAVEVAQAAFRQVVTLAAERQVPIMVFVGNPGMLQIHSGPVKKLLDHEDWFNVMDPDFNLHVKESAIAHSWIVRKPTQDGMVTALECFNERGEQIVQLFGKRKPGIPELEEWRSLVAEVEGAYLIG